MNLWNWLVKFPVNKWFVLCSELSTPLLSHTHWTVFFHFLRGDSETIGQEGYKGFLSLAQPIRIVIGTLSAQKCLGAFSHWWWITMPSTMSFNNGSHIHHQNLPNLTVLRENLTSAPLDQNWQCQLSKGQKQNVQLCIGQGGWCVKVPQGVSQLREMVANSTCSPGSPQEDRTSTFSYW